MGGGVAHTPLEDSFVLRWSEKRRERRRNYRYKSVGERINDFKEGREAISEAR